MTGWNESRAANLALGLVLLVLLFVGWLIVGGFGLSWDEPDNSALGRQALQTYLSLRPPAEWQSNLESKGPFFVALVEAISPGLARLRGSASLVEARHFVYFLTLPMATIGLYSLGRKLVRPWAALVGALLFVSQPLIFGHAFINPKDTPFMAFFLVSMALGCWMVDSEERSRAGVMKRGLRVLGPALLAGAALGLTTAIRLFGPFAGILVSGLGIARWKKRSALLIVVYWATAGIVALLAWPYLWGDPWGRLWESLQVMLHFPWGNLVLYRGLAYPSNELPWHYLPFTTVIQLTLPALLLAAAGGVLAVRIGLADVRRRALYLVLFLWVAIPYAFAVVNRSEVYDNQRQFLFAIPPLFLAAAVATEGLVFSIASRLGRVAFVGMVLLPGLVAILRIYPYPYIYYNELVGGVKGAYREYELDYWGTSYRAAMEALNQIAPTGAVVEVVGPWQSASAFARPDLIVVKSEPGGDDASPSDYLMVLTRANMDQSFRAIGSSVVRIEVDGAMLAEVRRIQTAPEG